jgi:hypothetical protein
LVKKKLKKLNHLTLELSIKHPELGVLEPSFAKSGDERKFQDEKSTQEKKKNKRRPNLFSHPS